MPKLSKALPKANRIMLTVNDSVDVIAFQDPKDKEKICVRVLATDKTEKVHVKDPVEITGLRVSNSGQHLAFADRSGSVTVLNIMANKVVIRFRLDSIVDAITFSSDSAFVAAGDRSGIAAVWDLKAGKELRRFKFGWDVTGVDFSPTGKSAAFSVVSRERGPNGETLHYISRLFTARIHEQSDPIEIANVETSLSSIRYCTGSESLICLSLGSASLLEVNKTKWLYSTRFGALGSFRSTSTQHAEKFF
jgi:WD40 repeat protein